MEKKISSKVDEKAVEKWRETFEIMNRKFGKLEKQMINIPVSR